MDIKISLKPDGNGKYMGCFLPEAGKRFLNPETKEIILGNITTNEFDSPFEVFKELMCGKDMFEEIDVPITNADHIRNMSNMEMAKSRVYRKLIDADTQTYAYLGDYNFNTNLHIEGIAENAYKNAMQSELEWLKKEWQFWKEEE